MTSVDCEVLNWLKGSISRQHSSSLAHLSKISVNCYVECCLGICCLWSTVSANDLFSLTTETKLMKLFIGVPLVMPFQIASMYVLPGHTRVKVGPALVVVMDGCLLILPDFSLWVSIKYSQGIRVDQVSVLGPCKSCFTY